MGCRRVLRTVRFALQRSHLFAPELSRSPARGAGVRFLALRRAAVESFAHRCREVYDAHSLDLPPVPCSRSDQTSYDTAACDSSSRLPCSSPGSRSGARGLDSAAPAHLQILDSRPPLVPLRRGRIRAGSIPIVHRRSLRSKDASFCSTSESSRATTAPTPYRRSRSSIVSTELGD